MSSDSPVCPECGAGATLLPIASRRKPVGHYLCRWCGHTWMAPKVSTERPKSHAAMVAKTATRQQARN